MSASSGGTQGDLGADASGRRRGSRSAGVERIVLAAYLLAGRTRCTAAGRAIVGIDQVAGAAAHAHDQLAGAATALGEVSNCQPREGRPIESRCG